MLTLNDARQWYSADDEVHGFGHIRRVYKLCECIGQAEGADMEVLLTAALLHDSQDSHPGGGNRDDHHLRSAEFAGKLLKELGWDEIRTQAVQECIIAHRYRKNDVPGSLEAKVLFDADKLDVLGAIGVVRALAYAFQVRVPAFYEPSQSYLQNWEKEKGEPHSAYHEYLFKLKKISSILLTPTARLIAESRQKFLDDFFEELAAEMRA
jgi:uncharacterized protein